MLPDEVHVERDALDIGQLALAEVRRVSNCGFAQRAFQSLHASNILTDTDQTREVFERFIMHDCVLLDEARTLTELLLTRARYPRLRRGFCWLAAKVNKRSASRASSGWLRKRRLSIGEGHGQVRHDHPGDETA
jgi:hypothetical protein